jgi:hypothetical protein
MVISLSQISKVTTVLASSFECEEFIPLMRGDAFPLTRRCSQPNGVLKPPRIDYPDSRHTTNLRSLKFLPNNIRASAYQMS